MSKVALPLDQVIKDLTNQLNVAKANLNREAEKRRDVGKLLERRNAELDVARAKLKALSTKNVLLYTVSFTALALGTMALVTALYINGGF